VDLSNDPKNCNACGQVCGKGRECLLGSCAEIACPADGGGDGTVCAQAGGGLGTCCSGGCVNTFSNLANCGTCGNACQQGQSCDFGSCVIGDCASPGYAGGSCTQDGGRLGTCCSGVCTVPGSNQDCGQCGVVCPAATSCELHLETSPPYQCLSGSGRVDCSDGGCAQGLVCDPGLDVCVAAACDGGEGVACSLGTSIGTCCTGSCVDLQTAPSHCGFCGNACDAQQQCSLGICQ
jgi:hypothetical protein